MRLSRTAERDATLDWATSDSTDRTASEELVATPGRDYEESSRSAVIAAGEREATLRVPRIEDDTWEVDESYQIVLTDTDGLPQGPSTRGVVSIVDDGERDPGVVEDAAEPGLLRTDRKAEVAVREVAPGSDLVRPGSTSSSSSAESLTRSSAPSTSATAAGGAQ